MLTLQFAADLPPAWDALAGDNYALRRPFLAALETGNPCGQAYHLFHRPDGRLDSIVVTCVAPGLNLAMYTPLTWRIRATLLHLPLSVTRPGYVLGSATRDEVERWVRSLFGYVVILNWAAAGTLAGAARGAMSWQISLRLRWRSFEDYLGAMRSGHRHRCRLAARRGRGLRFRFLADNAAFDERLHALYLRVNRRSRIRVETLGIDFFRAPVSRIAVCEHGAEQLGFIQLVENGTELVFAFIGYDEARNREHDIYLNLLLFMIRYAIERGFATLEMGQTAEDAKLKLGGDSTPLSVLIRHSNPLLHRAVALLLPRIGYRPPPDAFRVFREGGR